MTPTAAFAERESLFCLEPRGTITPGNILVCQTVVIGLYCCSNRETAPPAVTLPKKRAYISSPFCCFSTLTGSSKVEEQNNNNICTWCPWKSHKHSTFYCFSVGLRGWAKLLLTGKCREKSQNLRGLEPQHHRNTQVGGALGGLQSSLLLPGVRVLPILVL